jgi:NhaP-type Na+/H+ or K+/H+ antiporter
MLLAGVALENVPVDWLTRPLPPAWKSQIRQGALAVIFLRSGLELDWSVFRRAGPAALRLLLVPGIVEAVISGSVAHAAFGMPWLLAYALGFILKAVGPAIVIQLMFDLQKRGWGVDKGIPALVVAAASFDDLVAIFFYTLFINFAINAAPGGSNASASASSLALQLANGPISVAAGFAGGALLGVAAAATRVWSTRRKRTAAVLALALAFMYFMDRYHYDGAGALGALTLGVTASALWRRGSPSFLSAGPGPGHAREVEHGVGSVWWWLAQPLLFGCIGSGLRFSRVAGYAAWIGTSIAVIVSGWAPRPAITVAVVSGAGLTMKEKAFVAAAWLPKASVQAALATAPLDAIRARGLGPDYVRWGEQIELTAVFAILICATVGIVAVNVLAPMCLDRGLSLHSVGGEGAGSAPGPRPPPPALPSPFAGAAAVPPPPSHDAVEEAEAYALLRERESALASYMEEADALAAFVEVADAGSDAANYAKRVRLDALDLRRRRLRDYWMESAPSALDLFRLDDMVRARLAAERGPGAAEAATMARGAGSRRRSLSSATGLPRQTSWMRRASAAGDAVATAERGVAPSPPPRVVGGVPPPPPPAAAGDA